jgi:phosphate transport system permease protein
VKHVVLNAAKPETEAVFGETKVGSGGTVPSLPQPGNSMSSINLRPSSFKFGDYVFAVTAWFFAVLTLLMLAGILVALTVSSWDSIRTFGFGFLWSSDWNPPMERFGALIPVYGTLVTAFIALLIAVPVSFGIALFLTELSPAWLRRPLGTAIELLAAIPSIVYGMWGLLVFAPIFAEYVQPALQATLGKLPFIGALFAGAPLGIGLLSAGVILAIMVIPYIASVMRDVFEVTPPMLKESAYGLGCSTWEVMWRVVLPYTKTGVIGGIMLGLGRALGETMAVTFVIGNSNFMESASLFASGNSITSALANEFAEADPGLHTSALMELGLVLSIITLAVLVVSKFLLLRLAKGEGAKS